MRGWPARLYLTMDARSLALGRIVLALLLLLDLAVRVPGLTTWYTDDGLLPATVARAHPLRGPVFSFFLWTSSPLGAALGFAACAAAYAALLVGLRTRLAHVASAVCVLSLHGRVMLLQNGGDVVLGTLCLWTCFLPTGRRFSLDAWRRRLRGPPEPERGPVTSIAVLAILLQLATIYAFNAIHKDGATWREGSVVHYVLHQDRVVTALGVWLRPYMTPGLSRALSWGALGAEAALPILILTPIASRLARRLAIVLVLGLHAGFALLLNLGLFSLTMMAFTPYLLGAGDWDRLEALAGAALRRARPPAGSRSWRARAWRAVAGCGEAISARLARAPVRPAPRAPWLAAAGARVAGAGAAIVLLLAAYQVLVENRAVPRALRPGAHPRLLAAVSYVQLFQGWSMFAPDAPLTDGNVYVEAVTVDGRTVDPLNEAASRYPIPGAFIPPRLGQTWLFCDYIVRIPWRPEYHDALRRWVLRYHERTGRPEDRIVRFGVYLVEDDSPPPGETEPRNARARLLLEGRAGPS